LSLFCLLDPLLEGEQLLRGEQWEKTETPPHFLCYTLSQHTTNKSLKTMVLVCKPRRRAVDQK
jgi:hypothetical protein